MTKVFNSFLIKEWNLHAMKAYEIYMQFKIFKFV